MLNAATRGKIETSGELEQLLSMGDHKYSSRRGNYETGRILRHFGYASLKRFLLDSLQSISKRRPDKAIAEKISVPVTNIEDPSRMLQKLSIVLEKQNTINKL